MSPIRIPAKPGLAYEDVCEVRIIPKVGCFVIEVVYNVNAHPQILSAEGLSVAIDLGVDPLMTVVFNDPNIQPIIINGKPLKSLNQDCLQSAFRRDRGTVVAVPRRISLISCYSRNRRSEPAP